MSEYYDFTIHVQLKVLKADNEELEEAADAAREAAEKAISKVIVGGEVIETNYDYECYDSK